MEKNIFYYSFTLQESRMCKEFYFRLVHLDREVGTFKFILKERDLTIVKVTLEFDEYKKIGLMKNFISYLLLNFFELKKINSISLTYNLDANFLLKKGVNVYGFLLSLGLSELINSDLIIFVNKKQLSSFESNYLLYKKFIFKEIKNNEDKK